MTTCQDPLCSSSPCVLAGTIPAEGPLINRVNARASTFHVDLHRLSFFCYNWSMMQRAFAGGAPALWHGVACSCSSWMQADFLPSQSPPPPWYCLGSLRPPSPKAASPGMGAPGCLWEVRWPSYCQPQLPNPCLRLVPIILVLLQGNAMPECN